MALAESCVIYQDGDIVGLLLAYCSLLPYLIITYHASRFYACREVQQFALVVGFFLQRVAMSVIKDALQHPRPRATCEQLGLCDDHGMPSSHTGSIAFSLGVHALRYGLRLRRWRRRGLSQAGRGSGAAPGQGAGPAHMGWASVVVEGLEVAALAAATALTAASRVYLGYHSLDQVLAGAAFGFLTGAAFVPVAGLRVWDALCDTALGRALHLKPGAWDEADPLALEAELYRQRAAERRQHKKKAQ